jgi:hypothetical protein
VRDPIARLLVGVAVCAGCGGEPEPEPVLPVPALGALSFNLHGSDTITDPIAGPALADEIAALDPDVASLQECVSCETLLDLLPVKYALVPGEEPIAILYDTSRWELLDHGTIVLGDNDDGWGRREARWAEFADEDGGRVFVYSTHWCVPIRNDDDPCTVDRQIEYGEEILDHVAGHGTPSVIGGDFNVFDGFEDGPVVEFLVANGLIDTLREVTAESVVTYEGSPSFPPGRIDYLFTTGPVIVTAAAVATDSASDHRPVSATVEFP